MMLTGPVRTREEMVIHRYTQAELMPWWPLSTTRWLALASLVNFFLSLFFANIFFESQLREIPHLINFIWPINGLS
jgi:hypothetical protein